MGRLYRLKGAISGRGLDRATPSLAVRDHETCTEPGGVGRAVSGTGYGTTSLGQKRYRPCENLAQTGDVQGALLDLLLFLPGTPLIIKMRLLRG